jgi:RNA polymerase primary sigma factor/RNA polymerase sigma factor
MMRDEFSKANEHISALPSTREKLQAALRAEGLCEELDANQDYRVDVLLGRVITRTGEASSAGWITGKAARNELRQLAESVAQGSVFSIEDADETVLTSQEVQRNWGVSPKTLQRWRGRGLRSYKFRIEGRARLGYLPSCLDRFAREEPDLVRRARKFSRLDESERTQILRRTHELLAAGKSQSGAIEQIARESRRGAETIRQLVKNSEDSQLAPLDAKALLRQFRNGEPLSHLAEQHYLSVDVLKYELNRFRAASIAQFDLDYIESSEFERPDAAKEILASIPTSASRKTSSSQRAGIPSYVAQLYDVPLLTAEQERHLFRKYNFLKFRAARLREGLDWDDPQEELLDEIEDLYERAVAARRQLARANLRLVVAIAKRYTSSADDLFERISDGNLTLMNTIDKFDYSRGFKFSTYATWALQRNFARQYVNQVKQSERFRTGKDDALLAHTDSRGNPRHELQAQEHREAQVSRLFEHLNDRERHIIRRRYGFGMQAAPQTLQELGEELGISKERVRQLEMRALSKLRQAAGDEQIVAPDDGDPLGFSRN